MIDPFSHLDAIDGRIAREKARLSEAQTESERGYRQREIAYAQKERADEIALLAKQGFTPLDDLISDDELLAALVA